MESNYFFLFSLLQQMGTVGLPWHGVEAKTDPDNGEFMYRGRTVMMGYYSSLSINLQLLKDGEGNQ